MQRELVERARKGDHDAFAILVHERMGRMYGTAGLILGGRAAAEDAVQDTLLKAWRDLPRLRDPDRFDGWLRRLLVNACHDEGRRRRRDPEAPMLVEDPPATGDAFARIAHADELAGAFGVLDAEARAVVVLRYYLDLSTADAAAALRMREGTLKSKLHRSMKALAAALEAGRRAGDVSTEERSA